MEGGAGGEGLSQGGEISSKQPQVGPTQAHFMTKVESVLGLIFSEGVVLCPVALFANSKHTWFERASHMFTAAAKEHYNIAGSISIALC